MFFAANAGGDLGRSGLNASNRILKIDLGDIPEGGTSDVNITVGSKENHGIVITADHILIFR